MKCQKCGADMVPGHLYCDICGAEYQIVPDFEPEIENSIAKSLSDIRLDIGDRTDNDASKENSKEKKQTQQRNKKRKKPSFGIIFFLVLVFSAFVLLGYLNITTSEEYQKQQAVAAINREDYHHTAQIYEALRKKDTDNAYWYVKEAECRLMLNEEEQAYSLALQAVGKKLHRVMAYDFLLSFLETKENYLEMTRFLKECEYEEIINKYWEYSGQIPKINYESGSYDHSLFLTFKDGYEGTLYYTLDETIPDQTSLVYDAPIPLGNGIHVVKVIYINKFGSSETYETYQYEITSEIPLAPVVTPDSGTYTDAEMIELEIEDGTRVFYTTDATIPTMESREYTAPIPMPLGESQYNFIAYSLKETAGEVTTRSYNLKLTTTLSTEEAKDLLIQKLISTGHILDSNGAVQDRYGVFGYFYRYPVCISGSNYYVFEEHYLENQIKNPLGNFYGVNVISKDIYRLSRNTDGSFTKIHF